MTENLQECSFTLTCLLFLGESWFISLKTQKIWRVWLAYSLAWIQTFASFSILPALKLMSELIRY